MNILIYAANPNDNSAHSSLGFRLATAFEKLGSKVYYLYEENKLGTDVNYIKDNINYIPHICYVENITIKQFKSSHSIFFTILFLFKKLENKILNTLERSHLLNLEFAKTIDHIQKNRNIDIIICCSNKQRAIPVSKSKSKCHKIVLFHEIPLRNGNADKRLFDALNKKHIMIGVRKIDRGFFEGHHVEDIEFPLIDSYLEIPSIQINNNKLVYFGKFYKDIRNPEGLFKLLKLNEDYTCDAYGTFYTIEEMGVAPNNIYFHEAIPYHEMIKIITSSTALIVIENTNTNIKSSKLIELMAFNKPIIFIGDIKNFRKEINSYKKIIIYNNNKKINIESELRFLNDKDTPPSNFKFLDKYTNAYVANQILKLFSEK